MGYFVFADGGESMIQFLVDNPLLVILVCLGLGYLFGKINLGFFPNNATLGTLYAAIIMNIIISSNGGVFHADQVKVMKALFFALFTFVLGYDAGPVFRNAIRTSGIKSSVKLVGLSLFYCCCVLGCAFLTVRVFGFTSGRASGFLAGSQTQSTILNDGSDVVAYAICYIMATLGMILFVQKIAPALMKTDLITAVKEKIGRGGKIGNENTAVILPVQIRAYTIDDASAYAGRTVDELEFEYEGHLQIVSVYRDGVEQELSQSLKVSKSDVLVVVGRINDIDSFDDNGLTETTDEKYLSFEMSRVEIVISEDRVNSIVYKLSDKGILVNKIVRKGKSIPATEGLTAEKGDVISVTGRTKIIKRIVDDIGYVKDEGDVSDIPLLLLSIALAIPIGLIRFPGTSLTLGTSCCALIIGMIVGCWYDSKPRFGYIATGAKWMLKSVGLNLFIAATALERPLLPEELFTVQNIYVVLAGLILILIPAILAVLFGKMILKLASAEVLGGLCGCATSTPALNSLSEAAGSSIFTVGYAPAYVTSNICLTLVGSILMALLG